MYQKIGLFITTAVRTSNPTKEKQILERTQGPWSGDSSVGVVTLKL
jgi:hypothetical protein